MKRLKTYDDFLLESTQRQFGCAMLAFDLPALPRLLESVDGADLYSDPAAPGKFGMERDSHVTILYGVKDLYNIPEVTDHLVSLRELAQGCTLKLGSVSAFKNEKFDVLKYSAEENPFLYEMNAYMTSSVQWESDYPDYVPHCTIAYLQPGKSDKYVQQLNAQGLGDVEVIPKFVVYSRPDGQKTYLFVNK
jgi:2'-5' RNA ligase